MMKQNQILEGIMYHAYASPILHIQPSFQKTGLFQEQACNWRQPWLCKCTLIPSIKPAALNLLTCSNHGQICSHPSILKYYVYRVSQLSMQAYNPNLRPGVSFRNVLLSPPVPGATKLTLTLRQAHSLYSRL